MKHILFLGQSGFYKRDYERFQIKTLKKKFKIYFLDLTNLTNEIFYNKEKTKFLKAQEFIKFDTKEKFIKFFEKKRIDIVFDHSNPEQTNLNFFRNIINEKKIKLVNLQLNLFPSFKRNFFLKIKYFFKILFFNKYLLLYYMKNFILNKRKNNSFGPQFHYDYIFCAGRKGKHKSYIKKSTKFIFSHTSDYENFLNEKKLKKGDKKFFVFLDQYLPFHNGYLIRNIPPYVSSNKYYKSINNFFELIEKKFNTEVVISAHPSSNYKKVGNKFNNRKIIDFKKTNYLVSKCLGVINYTSTAMSYAVIHNKPIIFYTTNEIDKSHDAYHVNYISKKLGSKVVNIDRKNVQLNNISGFLKVDRVKYKNYLDNFVRHPKSANQTNLTKISKLIDEK